MSKARDLADYISTGGVLEDGQIDSTEINGVTVSSTELNYLSGASSNIQNQLDNISVTSGTLTKTFAQNEVATITLSSSITTPVVSVTKEVNQTGVTNNTWDVNSTSENYTRLDSAPATTLDFIGFDISTASFVDSFSVSAQETTPTGIAFNGNGTKMFVVGADNDGVFEYNLSTGFDVSTASYSQSFSVVSQDGNPTGIAFNTDGTKMFIAGYDGADINEYTLSTGFDLSTATYSQNFSISTQDSQVTGIAFNNDGTKMFIAGRVADAIYEYGLTTAFDVSTASYSQSFSVSSQDTDPRNLSFNNDGTKMFLVGNSSNSVYEYTLSTGFDVSSASYSQTLSVNSQDSFPTGIAFNNDGTKMFIVGAVGDSVNEYNISLSLQLGSGSFASADVGKTIEANGGVFVLTSTSGAISQTTAPTSYAQVASGSWEMYGVVYNTTDGDLELSKSSPQNTYNVSGATFASSQNILTYESSISGIQFNTDGTKMFIIGYGGVEINEFSLSVPYDPTSLSLNSTLSVSSQDSIPTDLYFKSDGLTLFVLGYNTQTVYEYTLTTAFDISTASYSSNSFSVSAQAASPAGIYFKDDGTILYVSDLSGYLQQYTISTAWDITTASYASKNLNVNSQDSSPTGLVFNSDGTKMYLTGYGSGSVHSYSVSTAWDISTASYDSISLNIYSYTSLPRGLTFEQDGATLFIAGQSTNAVIKFNSATTYIPSGYHAVHTTTSTDTTYWTDINSMTADEAAGDGSIFYCVSTDDRSTWKIAHNTDGIRSIVRNNSGTWQYNSNSTYGSETWTNATTNTELNALQEAMAETVGYRISNTSYDNVSFDASAQESSIYGLAFNADGTSMYTLGYDNDTVYQYTLSTAYDISTASYASKSFSVTSQDTVPLKVNFNTDGTKMFVLGSANDSVFQYSLSTGFDVSTASYDSVSFSVTSQEATPAGMAFNSDGTKMYIVGGTNDTVYQYSLSSAFDLSTASYASISFSVASQAASANAVIFNDDGTKMFVLDNLNPDTIYSYTLTTGFDVSTASYDSVSFDVSTQTTFGGGILFNGDGTKLLLASFNNGTIYQYSSTDLQAITANQMNKTQLDAVSDANHFTLANDLDLGIIFNLSSGTTVPSSDGVSINYDANVLNKGAILGTDYDFDAPAATKVRITALAANNLKVRVV